MPVLSRMQTAMQPNGPVSGDLDRGYHAPVRPALFPMCGNPHCRSGWLRLWRSRQHPIFDGRWLCSRACTGDVVRMAVARELDGTSSESGTMHAHRVPLGLILLSHGVITRDQLRHALDAQKRAGWGALGYWLTTEHRIPEIEITRALAAQWSCPVLSLDGYPQPELSAFLPRLLLEACGALPVHLAGNRILYLAFAQRIDRCLTLALEKMTGLRVEGGFLRDSDFHKARETMMSQQFPALRLTAVENVETLIADVSSTIEAAPYESRISRVHQYVWLRHWKRDPSRALGAPAASAVQDVVYVLGPNDIPQSAEAGLGR